MKGVDGNWDEGPNVLVVWGYGPLVIIGKVDSGKLLTREGFQMYTPDIFLTVMKS
jgi:hypothetical protein